MTYEETFAWPCLPVKQVDREEVATLYSFGHHDGPATGLIWWNGEYWYVDRFEFEGQCFWIVRLTEEQQKYALWYGTECGRQYSTSCTYNANGERVHRVLGPHAIQNGNVTRMDSTYDEFIKTNKTPCPSLDAEVVGYFKGWRAGD